MSSRTTLRVGLLASLVLVSGCAESQAQQEEAVGPAPSTTATSNPPADVCAGVDLVPGGTVSGPELGPCVIDRVLAAGSGRVNTHYEGYGSLLDAAGSFTTSPEFSVEMSFYDGAAGAVVIGDQAWYDDTMGWVAADPTGDFRQVNAAQITSVVRTTADPQANADFISMFETWEVTGSVPVTMPDGSTVSGIEVRAQGSQDLVAAQVSQASFVLDEEFRPLFSRAASSQLGATVFSNLTYSDWGAPVTIAPPL